MIRLYSHLREAKPETLLELLRFFDVPSLRPFYTGLISDVRNELARRGIDPTTEVR